MPAKYIIPIERFLAASIGLGFFFFIFLNIITFSAKVKKPLKRNPNLLKAFVRPFASRYSAVYWSSFPLLLFLPQTLRSRCFRRRVSFCPFALLDTEPVPYLSSPPISYIGWLNEPYGEPIPIVSIHRYFYQRTFRVVPTGFWIFKSGKLASHSKIISPWILRSFSCSLASFAGAPSSTR